MIQARDDFRFAGEFLTLRIVQQDLDGHSPVEARVGGVVDLSHSARGQHGLQLVRSEHSAEIAARYSRLFVESPGQGRAKLPAWFSIENGRCVQAMRDQRLHLRSQRLVALARAREKTVALARPPFERRMIQAFDRLPPVRRHWSDAALARAMPWRGPSRG
jgi:hypothetical protein